MSSDSATGAGRFQDTAFKVFAVVGFLSSVVTIVSWTSSSSASLTASITEKVIEVPQSLQLSKVTDEKYTLNNALEELSKKYCDPMTVSYDGTKIRNFDYNMPTCQKQKALYDIFRQVAALDGKPLLAYDVTITNDGSNVAENIKVRSPIDVDAIAFDSDGGPTKIIPTQPKRIFTLPPLNPREAIKIRLVSSTPVSDFYAKQDTKPQITFSGGKSSYQNYIYISGRYSDIVKFLDELPLILQIFFVALGAFLITLIWLLPVSLLTSAVEARKKSSTSQTILDDGA